MGEVCNIPEGNLGLDTQSFDIQMTLEEVQRVTDIPEDISQRYFGDTVSVDNIKDFIADNQVSHEGEEWYENLKILVSSEFHDTLTIVKNNFPGEINNSTVFRIFKRYPGMLQNNDFWEFIKNTAVTFCVERNDLWMEVMLYMDIYESPEESRKLLEHWNEFLKYFPEAPKSIRGLRILGRHVKVYKISLSEWRNLGTKKEELFSKYNLRLPNNWSMWSVFISLLRDDNGFITNERYIEINKYLGEYLPSLTTITHTTVNKYKDIDNFMSLLSISPESFGRLIQCLGVEIIDTISFTSNPKDRFIELFSMSDTERFTIDLLNFCKEFNLEGISENDFEELLTSYISDDGIDRLFTLNRAIKELGEDQIELDTTRYDDKIYVLQIQKGVGAQDDKEVIYEDEDGNLVWDSYALNGSKLLRSLENQEEFSIFWGELEQNFEGVVFSDDFIDGVLLFEFMQDNPEYEDILYSDNFKVLGEYLIANFSFIHSRNVEREVGNFPNIGNFISMLGIIDNFPYEEMSELVTQLNEQGIRLVPNDIPLLLEIVRNPDFRNLLDDNNRLNGMIKSIIGEEYSRKSMGSIGAIVYKLEEARYEGDIPEMRRLSGIIQDHDKNYSERPDLNTLSPLDNLRIWIFLNSINSQGFKDELGEIVRADIRDNTSELGGINILEGNNISFRRMYSNSISNRSYSPNFYFNFHGGVTWFHLHAVQLKSQGYAGPSGYELGGDYEVEGGGDLFVSGNHDIPGVVFTTLGHPLDASGNENVSKVLVNTDYFFVDKRDPNNPRQVVYDLGVIEVPYDEKLDIPDIKISTSNEISQNALLSLEGVENPSKQMISGILGKYLQKFPKWNRIEQENFWKSEEGYQTAYAVQVGLAAIGEDPGTINGIWGRNSQRALSTLGHGKNPGPNSIQALLDKLHHHQ